MSSSTTPAPAHEAPSLPSSPLPKRTKVVDPTPPQNNANNNDSLATMSAPAVAAATTAGDKLQVLLLSDVARAPTKGSAFAAGHDLYSARDIVIPARGRALVATDISVSVPMGTYGRVAPRSGLAAKHGIDTLAGVIDADYRGPVGVILANLSDKDFDIKVGDRIAQLIVEKIVMPDVVVVQKLEESVRGAGGFGSTGGFGASASA